MNKDFRKYILLNKDSLTDSGRIILGDYITDLQEEIKRLNKKYENVVLDYEREHHIIYELEKYLIEEYKYYEKGCNSGYGYAMGEIKRIAKRLIELKEKKQ